MSVIKFGPGDLGAVRDVVANLERFVNLGLIEWDKASYISYYNYFYKGIDYL